jgi:hypothetical protein
MWVVVKSVYQQQLERFIDLAKTLCALGKLPINTPLARGELLALLDELFLLSFKEACRHTKNKGTLTLAWHSCRLLRQWGRKCHHHLHSIALLSGAISTQLCCAAILLHHPRGLPHDKFGCSYLL